MSSEQYKKQYKLQLDLTGYYQKKNVKTVLSAVERLREIGSGISDEQLIQALGKVRRLTGLSGRWQILSRRPLTICDTGHNSEGIREVVSQLIKTPHRKLHIVFGMTRDKDIEQVLRLLPRQAGYYFCRADIPRALDENELTALAIKAGLRGNPFPTVKQALEAARKAAAPDDLIFVGGSIFVVAEVV